MFWAFEPVTAVALGVALVLGAAVGLGAAFGLGADFGLGAALAWVDDTEADAGGALACATPAGVKPSALSAVIFV